MTEPGPREWALPHSLGGMFNQYETRWSPSADNPAVMIREVRTTGRVCYVCNCGVATGWVERDTLPLPSEWVYEHLSDEDKVRWLHGLESDA